MRDWPSVSFLAAAVLPSRRCAFTSTKGSFLLRSERVAAIGSMGARQFCDSISSEPLREAGLGLESIKIGAAPRAGLQPQGTSRTVFFAESWDHTFCSQKGPPTGER